MIKRKPATFGKRVNLTPSQLLEQSLILELQQARKAQDPVAIGRAICALQRHSSSR